MFSSLELRICTAYDNACYACIYEDLTELGKIYILKSSHATKNDRRNFYFRATIRPLNDTTYIISSSYGYILLTHQGVYL